MSKQSKDRGGERGKAGINRERGHAPGGWLPPPPQKKKQRKHPLHLAIQIASGYSRLCK